MIDFGGKIQKNWSIEKSIGRILQNTCKAIFLCTLMLFIDYVFFAIMFFFINYAFIIYFY